MTEEADQEDLTARIAGLTGQIGKRLDEDEAVANAAMEDWRADTGDGLAVESYGSIRTLCAATVAHIARNDPARRLRDVKAARDLVAEILAERHLYVDGDSWFSCSQATYPGEEDEPGSACADDERRGKPCDCGRDATVARRLAIIAGEWETG